MLSLQSLRNHSYIHSTPQQLKVDLSSDKAGKGVQIIFNKATHELSASIMDSNGKKIGSVKNRDLPPDFKMIKHEKTFRAYFQDAYARISPLDNSSFKLSIQQRGRGGMPRAENTETDLAAKCISFIEDGLKHINLDKVKKASVMLVGKVMAGKSILANLLCGKPLVAESFVNGKLQYTVAEPIFPPSDSNIHVGTTWPTVGAREDKNDCIIDTPGFGDPEGSYKDIANVFFRKAVLEKTKNIKFPLLVDYENIYNRGTPLIDTLKDLIQFLGCTGDEEGLKEASKSICLIVTKVSQRESIEKLQRQIHQLQESINAADAQNRPAEATRSTRELLARLQTRLERLRQNPSPIEEVSNKLRNYLTADSPLSDDGKIILREILNNSRWTIFSAPDAIGPSAKAQEEKVTISRLIEEQTQPLNKDDFNIQTHVPSKYRGQVLQAILAFKINLKKELKKTLQKEFNAYLENLFKEKGEEELSDLQNKLHSFLETNPSLSLIEFAKELKKIFPLTDDSKNKFDKRHKALQFLIDLLPPESDVVGLSTQQKWLDEMDLKKPFQELDKTLTKMLEPCKATISDRKIIIQGFFPKMSDLIVKIREASVDSIESVKIFGLHTFTWDENATDNKLKGVNISIISPKWDINGQKTLNVSGNDCTHRYHSAADKEKDGKPGHAGKSGGNVLGIGRIFSNIEGLFIKSKGGKGGNGQEGGKGKEGDKGPNGQKETKGPYAHGAHWEHFEKKPDGNKNQRCVNYGQPGKPGTPGGKGGGKGKGGLPGTISITSTLKTPLHYLYKLKEGKKGDAGEGGKGGEGGKNGKNWEGVWHMTAWNGHHQPRHHKSHGRAAPGATPTDKNKKHREVPQAVPAIERAKVIADYVKFLTDNTTTWTVKALTKFQNEIKT